MIGGWTQGRTYAIYVTTMIIRKWDTTVEDSSRCLLKIEGGRNIVFHALSE